MKRVASLNYVDKANRHYRRMRAKKPGLQPLAPGGGRVIGNGKVELTVKNGARLVYRIEARIEYVAVIEKSFPPPKAVAVPPAASPGDQAKYHIDAALHILADVDSHAARANAAAPANVNHLNGVAAE